MSKFQRVPGSVKNLYRVNAEKTNTSVKNEIKQVVLLSHDNYRIEYK
jgi:hypothetical protein